MQYLLYFAGYRMVMYRWQNGRFTGMAEFEPDNDGLTSFENVLKKEVKNPLRMLIDIIEEDFRVERIPHVYGRDRGALFERTLKKHFRPYPYRHIRLQGRETDGRKDDIIMVSALTNYSLFKGWLDIIKRNKIPFEGIYSLPLIGEALLKPLGINKNRALIITQQVPSNIRQSFYVDGQLKLSRLAPSRDDAANHHEVLLEETERTVRYLENQHMYSVGEPLNIYIIVPMDQVADVSKILRSDTQKTYHIISREAIVKDIGLKQSLGGPYSDYLFAHLLLMQKGLSAHYGTPRDKRYFYHHRINQSLLAASVLTVLITINLAGFKLIEGVISSDQVPALQQETRRYQQLYENTISTLSDVNLNVNDIRDIVEVAEQIENQYQFSPFNILRSVARQLDSRQNIHIKTIDWVATYDHEHNLGETKAVLDVKLKKRLKRKNVLYQKAMLSAEVIDFDNNPRIAVETVQDFAKALSTDTAFSKVEILKMPFDLAPNSRVEGRAISELENSKNNAAGFKLIVIMEQAS